MADCSLNEGQRGFPPLCSSNAGTLAAPLLCLQPESLTEINFSHSRMNANPPILLVLGDLHLVLEDLFLPSGMLVWFGLNIDVFFKAS